MSKRVLVIVAHADDMEFMAGGTIAKMAGLGYDIREVIATNNERGTLDPGLGQALHRGDPPRRGPPRRRGAGRQPGRRVPGLRGRLPGRHAAQRAAREVHAGHPQAQAGRALHLGRVHAVRRAPDHRAVAMATTEAASFSHFPLYHPEHRDEGLEPHYVGERYFFAKSPRDANKIVDISDRSSTRSTPSASTPARWR